MKNIFLLSISILVLVIIGEIIYLAYSPTLIAQKDNNQNTLKPTVIQPTQPNAVNTNIPSALDQETIKRIQFTRSTGHISSILTQQFEGTIFNLSTAEYLIDNQLQNVNLLVLTANDIKDEQNMNTFVVSNAQEAILKVYEQSENEQKDITYQDLNIGDNITINVSMDMTKPITDNIITYIITKIN